MRADIQDYILTWRTPNHDAFLREAKVEALRNEWGRDWLRAERLYRGCR